MKEKFGWVLRKSPHGKGFAVLSPFPEGFKIPVDALENMNQGWEWLDSVISEQFHDSVNSH